MHGLVVASKAQMLRYESLQNWTIGQILIDLGRTAEPVRGSIPSAWITNASESEIRNAAALSGAVQLEIQHAGENKSTAEIRRDIAEILRKTKAPRQPR
jgi:hypothetical protein